jgi:2-polyprenyl-3-methyl-5-hydroxy-6-metoxy-1,4-benzoquinol methylase
MNAQAKPEPTRRGCDLCGATYARELYTAKDRLRNSEQVFHIAECLGCGVLRTLPEMTERELSVYYPLDYWGGDEAKLGWIKSSQKEKTDFISACELKGGSILDVGCGSGFFLRALDQSKWNCFGVETGEAAARAASRSLGEGHVFTGTLIDSACADAAFDVISFWSALEHTNEPRANLIEARRIIKHGGSLIIQVPNAASYQARMFDGDWFALDAPRHRYHFSLRTLNAVLVEAGFKLYRTTFFSKAHNAHALRQSLKSRLFVENRSAGSRALFYLSIPFIKPFDWLMTALGKGATLTLAARAM